jgi:hypothetical protein
MDFTNYKFILNENVNQIHTNATKLFLVLYNISYIKHTDKKKLQHYSIFPEFDTKLTKINYKYGFVSISFMTHFMHYVRAGN